MYVRVCVCVCVCVRVYVHDYMQMYTHIQVLYTKTWVRFQELGILSCFCEAIAFLGASLQ